MKEKEERSSETSKFVIFGSVRLVKEQLKLFILTSSSSLIYFITPLFLALITREIFNNLDGVPNYTINTWTYVMMIPIIILFQLITEITFSIFVWKFILKNKILLRKNMINGVFTQPGADSLEKSPGEAISRFRGDTEEVVWFTALIGDITAFFIFAVAAFIIMYNIQKDLTLITFAPFIVVVTLINLSRRKLTKYRDDARSAAGRVTGAVGETFGSIQAIKVASSEENVLKHFAKLNDQRRVTAIKDNAFAAIIRAMGKVIVSISTGVILLLVGQSMQRGTFTLGDLTLFIFLLNWLTGFIRFLGEFLAWFQRNKVSYDRMIKIMQGKSGKPDRHTLLEAGELYVSTHVPPLTPIEKQRSDVLNVLEINGLNFQYPSSKNGIYDINMTIRKGELNVLVGRVGSGKSTLLKCILGLLPINEGEIRWNGLKIEEPAEFFIPPRISYTSQVPMLFSTSVKDNILMETANLEDLPDAVKLAVVDDEIDSFEDKFETTIGPKGVRLSGGQKHRIAAARMLVRKPELLVFDDLSSALDVKTEEKLWTGLFDHPDFTYLVTSHRKYVLNRADRIYVMKEGRIIDHGSIKELLERSEEMRQLWEGKLETIEEIREEDLFQKSETSQVNLLLNQLQEIIPNNWKFYPTIEFQYKKLIHQALKDNIISSDEDSLLKNFRENIKAYGAILEKAVDDGVIDEDEKDELLSARENLRNHAHAIAREDAVISKDEKEMLEKIDLILDYLDDLEDQQND
ncbi:MAG: ATP-binding cassette domain-containing protein [Candidatus Heimdallarchaeota archaeon]|nr:ATP-binding cassette domain-containing protein [Candidatus Heimdallarchaeota archaeon]